MKLPRKIRRKIIRTLFTEQWWILICDRNGKILRELKPPEGCIWADPFPVEYEGKLMLFLEEQPIGGDGYLGYLELSKELIPSELTVILKKPYHLSWPNVFSVTKDTNTIWYMIPESNNNKTIDLYRAEKFPETWIHDSTLMSGIQAADTELYKENENSWWLFTSGGLDGYGMNDSLMLFHSDHFPSQDWKPHTNNPVITGRGKSRMAGKIYKDRKTGQIVRPAQYSVVDYGERVILNHIETLSISTYREKKLTTIYPEKKNHAVCTHTWNLCSEYVFRDILKRHFNPFWRFKKGKK